MSPLSKEDVAHFTWMFNEEFFLEVDGKGSYIWKDPRYGGDNTITPYEGSYLDYLEERNIPFGRDKGEHIIGEYCPKTLIIGAGKE